MRYDIFNKEDWVNKPEWRRRPVRGEWGTDDSVFMLAPSWASRGACAESEIDFAEVSSKRPGFEREQQRALAICAKCPVREECAEYALEQEGPGDVMGRSGVFGGMTPLQRSQWWQRMAVSA
jgi:WhiB family redox-sensing transcriptional regulator